MTGPEHYRAAEEKLRFAYKIALPESGHSDEEATVLVGLALQRAQVHATLALAAATAVDRLPGANLPVWEAWRKVAAPNGGESDG